MKRKFIFTFTCSIIGEGETEEEARKSITEKTDNLNQYIDEETATEIAANGTFLANTIV